MAELDRLLRESGRKRRSPQQLKPSSCCDDLPKLLETEHNTIMSAEQHRLANCHHHSWRERVSQWSYDVIDLLEAPRETVYVSMNILDRYVSTIRVGGEELLSDEYRLAAIASLFIAVRLSSGSLQLKMQRLLCISQSGILLEDAHSTVTKILKTLSLDSPILTPSAFIRALLGPLQDTTTIDKDAMMTIMEHAFYLAELSVCDQHFCGVSPSKIAFASVILSLHNSAELPPSSCSIVDQSTCLFVLDTIRKQTGMDHTSHDIQSLCSHLQATYGQSYDNEFCKKKIVSSSSSSSPPLVAIVESYDSDGNINATHHHN